MNTKFKLMTVAIALVGAVSTAHAQTIPSGAETDLLRLYREQFMPHKNTVIQVAQTPFDPEADLLRLYREQFMPRGNAVVQVAQTPFDPQADLLSLYRERFMPHTGMDRSLALKPVK
jgi:hypothetical protein